MEGQTEREARLTPSGLSVCLALLSLSGALTPRGSRFVPSPTSRLEPIGARGGGGPAPRTPC